MTAAASAAAPAIGSGYIDAHSHVWTPDVAKYPLASGFKLSDMLPPSFTADELLAEAEPCGVDRVVLIQMSFYRYDNSYMLDMIRRYPGRFRGVAVIDPQAEHVAATMRSLTPQGVTGYRLFPRGADPEAFFAQPGIDAMWKVGASDGLNMCLLINPNMLAIADQLCTRHPNTPVVIDHYARIGTDGTIRESDLSQLCNLSRHKHVTVKLSAYYALGKKQMPYDDLIPMTRRLLDAYGVDRLMWATDCPYQVQQGHTYRSSVDFIAQRLDFLSAGDKQSLLRNTAQRVFFR